MKNLIIWLVCGLLTGCTLAEANEMQQTMSQAKYGQTRDFAVTEQWAENDAKIVLQHDSDPLDVPTVRTLLLDFRPVSYAGGFQAAFRWSVTAGNGGVRKRLLIDGLGTQQIAMPAQQFTLAVLAQQSGNLAYVDPVGTQFSATALVADGTATTFPATLTNSYVLPNGSITVPVPDGAIGWRVGGNHDPAIATSPFQAAVFFESDALIPDRIRGSQLDAIQQSSFVPLPGNSNAMLINNAVGNDVEFYLQWMIEL